jgi:perosamine synthetase
MRTVLTSGWLTSGKNVEALEKGFAETVGTRHAVALNSCTAALHAILLSLDMKPGDEVIVPSNTFVATANAALYTGAKPVFADSDRGTFNLSPEDVELKISDKTKAIIAVHLAGNPCDMKQLSEIAEDHQLSLVEDCAHAHGSKAQGKNCGSFGEASAFSLYATKIITAGEGGMVTTDDEKIAQRIRRIRTHGRGGIGPVETTGLGYNYRLSDIHAVIGLSQMKHLPDFIAQRQQIARSYNSFLSHTGWAKPQLVRAGDVCPYYVYLLKLAADAPFQRNELAAKLSEKGIGTSVLYYPVHTQPFYKSILDRDPKCPVAEELGKRTIALPLYNGMSKDELEFVKQKWREISESTVEQYASIN